jgi:hypothetical protein
MSDNARKRSRNEETKMDDEDPPFTKAEDLWLHKGSVVLIAPKSSSSAIGESPETLGFRVHQSVLAARSGVFADMFACPQPLQQEEHDGYPVVRMSDLAEDLAHVLNSLYNPA